MSFTYADHQKQQMARNPKPNQSCGKPSAAADQDLTMHVAGSKGKGDSRQTAPLPKQAPAGPMLPPKPPGVGPVQGKRAP